MTDQDQGVTPTGSGSRERNPQAVSAAVAASIPDAVRFQKLPVEVEAFRLGYAWPDWWGVAHMANRVTTHNLDGRHRGGPDFALIHTLEGQMRAEFGDWIIRGVKGEIYPCKPEIFALTYAPVPNGDAPDPTPATGEEA
jgi:hypothetical protein